MSMTILSRVQSRKSFSLITSIALLAVSLGLLGAAGARAQSFSVLAGGLRELHTTDQTYTWSLAYQHPVYHGLGLGAAWINEGHLPNHHRDGLGGQLWLGTKAAGASLAVGAGPYYYFDTTKPPGEAREIDSHGWGVVYSAVLSWQLEHRWVQQLRVNRVASTHQPATTSVLYGLGYSFRGDEGDSQGDQQGDSKNSKLRGYQLSALAGVTIVNSFSSETNFAKSVELRGKRGEQLEWTVAWLSEGSSGDFHRDGFTAQGWLARGWHEGNTTLALGVGPYAIVDASGEERLNARHLAGMASLSVSQRFAAHWRGRITFNRVVGTHPFDSDVLLVGTSFEF